MAALIAGGSAPSLTWMPAPRTWTAEDLLHVVQHGIPRGPGPLVVTIDNAAIHRSHVVADALPELRRQGIYLDVLPPYASELNAIEPSVGAIKHHDLPERTDHTIAALDAAVDQAFTRAEARLLPEVAHQLRPAA